MNFLRLFHTVLIFLFIALSGLGVELRPSIEILIPKGMPIRIEINKDDSDQQTTIYEIKRKTVEDAVKAKITIVMIDHNGVIVRVKRAVADHLNDPMSMATGDTRVVRILLVVEWLETDRGKWILDMKTQELDVDLLVKRGAAALPRSMFIPK